MIQFVSLLLISVDTGQGYIINIYITRVSERSYQSFLIEPPILALIKELLLKELLRADGVFEIIDSRFFTTDKAGNNVKFDESMEKDIHRLIDSLSSVGFKFVEPDIAREALLFQKQEF